MSEDSAVDLPLQRAEIPVVPDFAEHFGDSERTDLETTYRSSAPVAADATAAKRSKCVPRVALG